MKNILYLHAGAELYGADIVLLQLLKNLDREQFNLHVILPCNGPLVSELRKNSIEVKVLEYPILRRKYFNFKGVLDYTINYYKKSKLIKEYCEKNNIDIVHTNTLAVLEGIYLKKRLQIIHIWHVHEIITRPKLINLVLTRLLSKYSDKAIAVSNAVKDHLIKTAKFNTGQISVIYNGVDNDIFNPNNEINYLKDEFKIGENEIVVGMIGRVNGWKGQASFLEAMNFIMEQNTSIRPVMVGGVFEGEEWRMNELKDIVKNSQHKDKIIIQDYRKDTPNLNCLFDIFVLPSIQPDPLPTVVLEAMASGTPIVGYRHGGIVEMVKENYNGLLVETLNTSELADKILQLVNNEELMKRMGINSNVRQKEFFSLKSYVKNFTNIYKEF